MLQINVSCLLVTFTENFCSNFSRKLIMYSRKLLGDGGTIFKGEKISSLLQVGLYKHSYIFEKSTTENKSPVSLSYIQ